MTSGAIKFTDIPDKILAWMAEEEMFPQGMIAQALRGRGPCYFPDPDLTLCVIVRESWWFYQMDPYSSGNKTIEVRFLRSVIIQIFVNTKFRNFGNRNSLITVPFFLKILHLLISLSWKEMDPKRHLLWSSRHFWMSLNKILYWWEYWIISGE